MVASLSPEWGGPTRVVSNLLQTLTRIGVQSGLVAAVGDRVGNYEVDLPDVEVQLVHTSSLACLWTGYSPGLAKVVDEVIGRYDVVHIHELWHYLQFASCRAAIRAGKPYIVTIHGQLEPGHLKQRGLRKRIYGAFVQRRILQGAAVIHALTNEEERQIRAFGVTTRVAVVPNGVRLEDFEPLPPRSELEKSYPDLMGKQVVLWMGRIHPNKGLDLLASGFAKLTAERSDVRLVLAGPDCDGYRGRLEAKLASYGVLGRTIFTGMLLGRDKLAALARADLFVLPSYVEAFGMVLLEAMSCGIPVVITSGCRLQDVVKYGGGEVVDPDAEQIARVLSRLLDAPDLRRRMGERGRRLVQDRFTCDRIAARMVDVYRSVANANEGDPRMIA